MNQIKSFFISVLLGCPIIMSGQNQAEDTLAINNHPDKVPFLTVFNKLGANTLNSFTYNYGLNYAVTPLITCGMVKSGIDWRWNRLGYNNKWVAYSGTPFGAIGFAVPVAVPLWLYVRGRKQGDIRLQATGLAIGQSAMLALSISFGIKAFTGRREPGIMEHHFYPDRGSTTDYSDDWAWGFMKRGVFSGWPSSHTIVSFAMATTLAEMYPEYQLIKWCAFAYAGSVGLGVSLFSHWASEVVAGAFMGYAIGKSVGVSFNQLIGNSGNTKRYYLLYPVPNGIGLTRYF
ncbi:MAG: phosphatase PAP2 family protein [Prevotellaceae bacterium]|jgi:membrane-associated phospholipid phosphatase|nr:phosphatase PAP2 family protein [Prevotellaceae bacterium]